GHVSVSGLKPSTRYYYLPTLEGKPMVSRPYPSITTAPVEGEPGRVSFAFVSCAGKEGSAAAAAWASMEAKARPDMVLMLGDNHYADSTDPVKIREAYLSHRRVSAFQELARRTAFYGIWDDHDYGPNDSDRTADGKERSLKTFNEYWANPGAGEPDNPGIYYSFRRGDVEFFMLDDRYHRSPNSAPADGTKTMLGKRQLAWLKKGLKESTAKVKFVASGSEWHLNGHRDSWTSFKREQTDVLNFLKEESIENVILLSGDRHFTGGYQINGQVMEVTSGPIGSGNFPTPNLPDMFMNHGEGKLYCVFDVDTRREKPVVLLEVYRAGQGLIETRDFTMDEINGKKKLALLPLPVKSEPVSKMPRVYSDDFSRSAGKWTPTDPDAWRIVEVEGNRVYSLHRQSKYKPPHRSPVNISLINDVNVGTFELHARVLTTTRDYGHRSMCLFFGYQDPTHFYYVHLGQKADDHANQIFIVNEAPRVKISETTTEGTPWNGDWHDVKIVRNVGTGEIAVYWDDMENPVMTATDKTFTHGQVGLGSFDDTGNWDDIQLFGEKVKK
ncbi:MAG: alkaline phosphatase D family protein, partial [Verrucomicrobiota bacterium]